MSASEPRRVVDKETFIIHYSALSVNDTSAIKTNGYEYTKCGVYYDGLHYHEAGLLLSQPSDVTCVFCIGDVDAQ